MKPRARNRLGRNEPCWCGSGKKFKLCHKNRDREEPDNPFEGFRKLAAFNTKRLCLHPEAGPSTCSDKIVRAHTIQRGRSLVKLAENGHVVGFACDPVSFKKNKGKLGVKPIGINNASTFNGFCSFHDNKTFEPIDAEPFIASDEQCFLFGYRAHCRELYQKETAIDGIPFMKGQDKGRNTIDQVYWQNRLSSLMEGFDAGYRDLIKRKERFDNALLQSRFSDAGFYVIQISAAPDVMATFGFNVQFDFEGIRLQDVGNVAEHVDAMYVSLIATDTGGAIVFSWIEDTNGACYKFIRSLNKLDDNVLPDAIVRLVFEHSENTFFRPSWWNELGEEKRTALLNRITTAADFTVPRLPTCLQEDGFSYVDWKVQGRLSNRI